MVVGLGHQDQKMFISFHVLRFYCTSLMVFVSTSLEFQQFHDPVTPKFLRAALCFRVFLLNPLLVSRPSSNAGSILPFFLDASPSIIGLMIPDDNNPFLLLLNPPKY